MDTELKYYDGNTDTALDQIAKSEDELDYINDALDAFKSFHRDLILIFRLNLPNYFY